MLFGDTWSQEELSVLRKTSISSPNVRTTKQTQDPRTVSMVIADENFDIPVDVCVSINKSAYSFTTNMGCIYHGPTMFYIYHLHTNANATNTNKYKGQYQLCEAKEGLEGVWTEGLRGAYHLHVTLYHATEYSIDRTVTKKVNAQKRSTFVSL